MNPTKLTDLCVDSIAKTGQDEHYRCPGCATNLTWDIVRDHAMGCSNLRDKVIREENEREAPGTRVAYDFKSQLVVRIQPEANGDTGLYSQGERMCVVPGNVTDAAALAIVTSILGAYGQGIKAGRSEKGREILAALNNG